MPRFLDPVRRRPLVVLLPLQAFLLLVHPGLLDPWGDELFTLDVTALAPGEMLARLKADIHPPLYFWLASLWRRAAGGEIESLRLLSAMFALASTLALDRFFLRSQTGEVRGWALALWCLSPCAVLYARMARSYSLQTLLAILVFAAAGACRREPARTRRWAALAVSAAALLYTHYVPGIALLAAALLHVWPARRRAAALLAAGAAVACYAPWLASFGFAVSRWGAKQTYALSGSAAFEHLLKLGYWLVSFQTGETYWGWLLFGGIALSLPLAAVALAGAALRPPWLASWLAAAAIGYAGVSRWVAYPFVPARMLWLLPLYTLLIALGAAARPRWRPAAAAVLALNAVSLAAYFSREGFLNKAYAAPYHEMAARISAGTGGADAVLLVDCCNADIPALLRYLRAPLKVESAGDEASLSALLSRFDARPPRRVWLYRNGHDISPGGVTARLESELGRRYIASREVYLPYSPGERALMKLAGVGAPPASFYVLVRFDKPERGGGL